MSEELKEFNYTIGIFDVMCRTIRMRVKEATKKEGKYGIGVYTDRFCEQELMTCTMKKLEERMQIAKCLDGVDFTFSVDTRDPKLVEEVAKDAYLKYLNEQKSEEEVKSKKYGVGFVIGSFDVFHAGHLENLKIAKSICDKLVVVLKTDERIIKNKKKTPRQATRERASILSCISLIDDILYMDLDTTRKDIINDIMEMYEDIELSDIIAIFGSDVQEKEKVFTTDWADINIAFTQRDPEKMKIVSSTNYQKICDANGGIEKLERMEEENIM